MSSFNSIPEEPMDLHGYVSNDENSNECSSDGDYEDDDSHSDIPFFADATLDLEEAQGIAPTPDLTLRQTLQTPDLKRLKSVELPNISSTPGPMLDSSTTNNLQQDISQEASENLNQSLNDNLDPNTSDNQYSQETMQNNGNSQQEASNRSFSVNAIHGENNISYTNQPTYRPRPPRRPRDAKWTTIFLVVAPMLFLPSLFHSKSHTVYHSSNIPVFFATILAIFIARIFYLSKGAGEGEDQRYLASQLLIIANMATCFILPLLTLTFYNLNVYGSFYDLIVIALAYLTLRDIYLFAKIFRSGSSFLREGVNDGERAFYRMLVNASLDILSRSCRCQSFYRVVVVTLFFQWLVLVGIRKAWEAAMSYHTGFGQYFWVSVVCFLGYWAASVQIRFLSYLACGGVTSWFAQQSALIEDMEIMRRREQSGSVARKETMQSAVLNENGSISDAYRDVDASAYSMGIEFDEGMDDDYGDDDGIMMGAIMSDSNEKQYLDENDVTFGRLSTPNSPTVKAFLKTALGISFGSIVHCALMGAAANVLWSFVRSVDWVLASSSRFANRRFRTYQGMNIGDDFNSQRGTFRERLQLKWQSFRIRSKTFVRNHNDLGLCHVAAYYKSYTRAANDVLDLINASGIESTIHEDISVHMCASISKVIAGLIVIFIGQSATPENDHMIICEIMVITFIMVYIIVYTMMEPLKASIKAVYVCFAQNHQSLSQAFPLVYHRLERISRENESTIV